MEFFADRPQTIYFAAPFRHRHFLGTKTKVERKYESRDVNSSTKPIQAADDITAYQYTHFTLKCCTKWRAPNLSNKDGSPNSATKVANGKSIFFLAFNYF
jgi:hypothetical protein